MLTSPCFPNCFSAREGVGIHLVLADRITTELHDDGVLFRQLLQRPANL
jgi:hypothetical protein